MKIHRLRARSLFVVVALAAVMSAAWSRPALVAPQRLNVPPIVTPEYAGYVVYGQPVIDGDTLLVPASRAVGSYDVRREGVFLFERGGNGTWNYVRPLLDGTSGNVHLQGNLAVIQSDAGLLIFERGAQGWALADTLESSTGEWHPRDRVSRLDGGSIYVSRYDTRFPPSACLPPHQQYRKVNGTWTAIATIGGERCDYWQFDVDGGHAIALEYALGLPAFVYAQIGGPAWPRVGQLARPTSPPFQFGPNVAISGTDAYVEGGHLFRNTGVNAWGAAGRLLEPEVELGIANVSEFPALRAGTLVLFGAEQDYVMPALELDVFYSFNTLRVYRKRANGLFDYFARLAPDNDLLAWDLDDGGRRIAAIGSDSFTDADATRLYVFELPNAVSFNGTQQDTFETGNFARWTRTSGDFAVATRGATRVLRQSSLAGDAHAYLTAIDWTDQSVEADLRPLGFAGADRWFGLVTRRVDAQNFYYVTFRAPRVVSLRRMRDGAVTELGRATLSTHFVPGHSYRVRLESVADQHVVFVEGVPVVRAKDSTHAHGHPGIASYRARFEADNVVVSNATRLTARFDTWERAWANAASASSGTWQLVIEPACEITPDGICPKVMRQSNSSGDAKWFSRVALGNHVVSARVRPSSYGATTPTQDAWFGLAAQVKDERNYYYITLRDSNQLSLRRMINGTVQVLATVPQNVTTGTWYDLRLEIVNTSIRAYVNGNLLIQMNDASLSGGGRNALLTYKTAADWESYFAYQP